MDFYCREENCEVNEERLIFEVLKTQKVSLIHFNQNMHEQFHLAWNLKCLNT